MMKSILYLALILLMVFRSDSYIPAVRHALYIWGVDVVPSLFPYMVFCNLLASQLRQTRIPPACTAAVLGMLGGSPSGASILSVYGKQFTPRMLLTLTALTGTISPMFLLNTVKQWIQDAVFTRHLLLSHLLAAMITAGLVYAFAGNRSYIRTQTSPIRIADQTNPIVHSISAVLNIGGCIVVYCAVSVFVCSIPPLSRFLAFSASVHAFFEAAGGIHALSTLPETASRAVLIAAASGFSGLSILSQNLFFLHPLGIHLKHLTVFALLRALISGGVMYMLQCFN